MMALIRTALIFGAVIFFGAQFIASRGVESVLPASAPVQREVPRSTGQFGSEMRVLANGTGTYAPVKLREVRLGSFVAYDVDAVVIGGEGSSISLLGMSFLRLLQSYEVVGDELRLRW